MKPLVSIIIPAYNKAGLTVRCVESVLGQTYPNVEILLIDDGSIDDTQERMKGFGDRIRYVRKENGGACSARNAGIRLARGEYIGFLDCDDSYLPEKIERSIDFLSRNAQFSVVHTAVYFIDENGDIIREHGHPQSRYGGEIARKLIMQNYICNSTPIIKRACLDKAGLFDESIFTPADWDMWLRLAEHCRFGFIAEPLTRYCVTDNYIFKNLGLAQKEEHKVIEKYFERNPSDRPKLYRKALSSLHLRYAQAYLVQKDHGQFKGMLKSALRTNPFNGKALAVLLFYVFAQEILVKNLTARIRRYAVAGAGD